MTHRERMLATVRGDPTDELPWAPRMDLWYIARRARGTLPAGFDNLDIAGIADRLGVGCRALGGDHTLTPDPSDWALRAFGIENHPDYPYRVELRALPVEFRKDGDWYHTTVRTSVGPVTTRLVHNQQMYREGVSMPFVKEFPIRSPVDFEAVAQVFDHLEVIPTPDAYAAFRRRIGDRGLAVAKGSVGASPIHHIFHEMLPQEQFFYLYADERAAIQRLASRITPFFDKVLEAVLCCDAEVVSWSGNFDQDLTWPAFFKAEIVPWMRKVADRVHAAGRFLLAHTDGENQNLLPYYPACGFDIAESVCPAPMTRCTLAQLRAGFGPGTTVWGGIPSVALLESSMDTATFETFLDKTFSELGCGDRLILGVSDNVPPDAAPDRLERIRDRIMAFGPVQPGQRRH